MDKDNGTIVDIHSKSIHYADVRMYKACNHVITCVAYSHNGKFMAIGTKHNGVYIKFNNKGNPGQFHHILSDRLGCIPNEACITSVVFSFDDKLVFSGSSDKSIKVWNTDTGVLEFQLNGHTRSVKFISVSSDGQHIISGSDKTVRIWNITSKTQIHQLDYDTNICSVTYSPNSKYIIINIAGTNVSVLDAVSYQEVYHLDYEQDVSSIVISPDNVYMAIGSYDNTIRIYNFKTGDIIRILYDHKEYVYSIAFSPDSRFMASSSADHTIQVWDVTTWNKINYTMHSNDVFVVAFNFCGVRVLSTDSDNRVPIWTFEYISD